MCRRTRLHISPPSYASHHHLNGFLRQRLSVSGQFEQDDLRLFVDPIKDDLTTVPADVEVDNCRTTIKVRQLPFVAALEIERPEVLLRNVSLQEDQHVLSKKSQMPGAPSENQGV